MITLNSDPVVSDPICRATGDLLAANPKTGRWSAEGLIPLAGSNPCRQKECRPASPAESRNSPAIFLQFFMSL
jgi:hypothetical protein